MKTPIYSPKQKSLSKMTHHEKMREAVQLMLDILLQYAFVMTADEIRQGLLAIRYRKHGNLEKANAILVPIIEKHTGIKLTCENN